MCERIALFYQASCISCTLNSLQLIVDPPRLTAQGPKLYPRSRVGDPTITCYGVAAFTLAVDGGHLLSPPAQS